MPWGRQREERLNGVLVKLSVRVEIEVTAMMKTGSVEAVFRLEGAILELEGAEHPESGGFVDDVLPFMGDAIGESMEVLEGTSLQFLVLLLGDVEGGEDDVKVVSKTIPADVKGEMVEVEAAVADGGGEGAKDLVEGFDGVCDGARIVVGVNIDEEEEDLAALLDEGECDVGALSGIETVEVVQLVGRDKPATAVHGGQVSGLASGSDERCEEGVQEALLGESPSRRPRRLIGRRGLTALRTCATGGNIWGHVDSFGNA